MSHQRVMRVGVPVVSFAAGAIALSLLVGVSAPGCGSDKAASTGTGGAGGSITGTGGTAGSGGAGGSEDAGATDAGNDVPAADCKDDLVDVAADITTDTTWACNSYVLTRKIHITNNATLFIAAGSTIYGNGNATNPAALISTREGRLVAVGTADKPIVFTSFANAGERVPGDTFAGVVLLGKATVNNGTCQGDPDPATTACEAPGYFQNSIEGIDPADTRGQYGGSDDSHDCGELKYVRVEFGGFIIGANNELNGITVGGCGSETKMSYIQVHRGLDDGIEFFGGTASMDHVVISGVDDDALDWDFGWRGKVQFLIVHQGYGKGDKGFEADNNPTTHTAVPHSKPEIWNATLIGEETTTIGMHLKNGTRGTFRNFIVQGFGGGAVDVAATMIDPATEWPANLSIESSLFFKGPLSKDEAAAGADNDMMFDEAAVISDAARMNDTTADPMLGSTAIANPNYVPGNAAAVNGKGTPPAPLNVTATYAGAVAPGEAAPWYMGWTSFPEN